MNMQKRRMAAHRMILRNGGAGFLVRAGVQRPIVCARMEYTPTERGNFLDGSERFYISAVDLEVGPDHELDEIEFKGDAPLAKRYKILLPPGGPRPSGLIIYYDCNVVYSSTEPFA